MILGEKMTIAEMKAEITSEATIIFARDVKVEDGESCSLRPALLGFNQRIYEDAGKLFDTPLGPPEEEVEINIKYEIFKDEVRVYYTPINFTAKRFLVVAALYGIRKTFHEDVISKIKELFKDEI